MEFVTLTSLIAKLRAHDELPYVEAKMNLDGSEKIAQTFSALANSASYHNQESGYMIWWIEDSTWEIVGTNFSLEKATAITKNGSQKGPMWIRNSLEHKASWAEYVFTIEWKRVYIVEIKNCWAIPLRYNEIAYIREANSNAKLSNYPEIANAIYRKSLSDWSAEICSGVDTSWLDESAIRLARAWYETKHPRSSKSHLSDEQFLIDLWLIYSVGDITNAAIILLGKEHTIRRYIHRHQVFFEYRSIHEKTWYDERKTWQKSVFLMLDDIWNTIDRYNTLTQYSEGLLGRKNIYSINQDVTKELLVNALIHQDWRLPWQVDIRLSPEYLTVINPGWFMPWVDIDDLIGSPSRPRNQRLADVADKLNLMERSGQWMDLIFSETIKEWKWKPSYSKSNSFTIHADVPLTIVDIDFIKYISHISEDQQKLLSAHEYLFLESLRTGEKIDDQKTDTQKLFRVWLIESIGKTRWKRWILSQQYYEDHSITGKHTAIKWLERDEYKALILKHLEKYGKCQKKDILFHEKTAQWVWNILTELKKDWLITHEWSHKNWVWILHKDK